MSNFLFEFVWFWGTPSPKLEFKKERNSGYALIKFSKLQNKLSKQSCVSLIVSSSSLVNSGAMSLDFVMKWKVTCHLGN